jgi:excisionase family DNA binding protein
VAHVPFTGDLNRLVTLSDAARCLAVSVRSVRRFIDYGYLEGYRVGPRAIRVQAGAVNALLTRMPGGYADGGDGDPGAVLYAVPDPEDAEDAEDAEDTEDETEDDTEADG